jgi:hypothetical protein
LVAAFPLNSTRSDSVFWAAWEAVPEKKANATKIAGTEGTAQGSRETMGQIRLETKVVVIKNEFYYVM